MSETISVYQTGPLTFEIRGPVGDPSEFAQKALSSVEKAVVTESHSSRIEGHYQFSGGDLLVPFSVSLEQSSPELTILELGFSDNDPEWRTDLIRDKITEALAVTSAASSQAHAPPQKLKPPKTATRRQPQASGEHHVASQTHTITPSDYKTTSGLGSLFAIIGWVGVALSVIGALFASQSVGIPGIGAGFIAALFCLMIVAAGQLLRAQVEVANNSRLILMRLEEVVTARE